MVRESFAAEIACNDPLFYPLLRSPGGEGGTTYKDTLSK